MNNNALSVANYFIDLSIRDRKDLKLLGLMKRVYIAYGFGLVMLEKSIIDNRFDSVEAWKYGPVIPSVYHSFKSHEKNPITNKTVASRCNNNIDVEYFTPTIECNDVKRVIEFVWNRYDGMSDRDIVELTHRDGTPWSACYQAGANVEIPESFTKLYYEKIIDDLVNSIRNG